MYIWGKGQSPGRVGSDFLSAIAGRVSVSTGRVGSKKSDPWTTLIKTARLSDEKKLVGFRDEIWDEGRKNTKILGGVGMTGKGETWHTKE